MILEFARIVTVWLAVALALLWQHARWRHLREWKRYVIGTLTLCIGCAIVGVIVADLWLVLVPLFLATAGGPIVYLYQHEDPSEARARRLATRAKIHRLTQADIDRLPKERHECGLDEDRRAH